MASLTERIVRAHGGQDRWAQVSEVMACVTMGGWDFTSRLQPRPLRDVEVTAALGRPLLSISPYPAQGRVGFFSADSVWIEDERGNVLDKRQAPADVLRSFKHWLSWDALDVLYYAGLQLWQTLSLPALLLGGELELTELAPQQVGEERWQRMSLRYPERLPSLAAEQVLYADPAGLVRRLDFSPSFYGGWLGFSQLWEAHDSFGGFIYPTRQVLHPCLLSGQVWRLTTLVWLELDDVSIISRAGAQAGPAPRASDAEGSPAPAPSGS